MVALIVLEPWTTTTPEEGISGFADPATITVLAMFVTGEGVRRSGAVQTLSSALIAVSRGSERRSLASIVGVSGLVSGFINDTPVVAVMIPVGVDAAVRIGADPFSFVLAVTFAASTSMLSPIGYRTNLMVYGPGGYEFTDFFRVGAPLQPVLAVVTTLGIAAIWGV